MHMGVRKEAGVVVGCGIVLAAWVLHRHTPQTLQGMDGIVTLDWVLNVHLCSVCHKITINSEIHRLGG